MTIVMFLHTCNKKGFRVDMVIIIRMKGRACYVQLDRNGTINCEASGLRPKVTSDYCSTADRFDTPKMCTQVTVTNIKLHPTGNTRICAWQTVNCPDDIL